MTCFLTTELHTSAWVVCLLACVAVINATFYTAKQNISGRERNGAGLGLRSGNWLVGPAAPTSVRSLWWPSPLPLTLAMLVTLTGLLGSLLSLPKAVLPQPVLHQHKVTSLTDWGHTTARRSLCHSKYLLLYPGHSFGVIETQLQDINN